MTISLSSVGVRHFDSPPRGADTADRPAVGHRIAHIFKSVLKRVGRIKEWIQSAFLCRLFFRTTIQKSTNSGKLADRKLYTETRCNPYELDLGSVECQDRYGRRATVQLNKTPIGMLMSDAGKCWGASAYFLSSYLDGEGSTVKKVSEKFIGGVPFMAAVIHEIFGAIYDKTSGAGYNVEYEDSLTKRLSYAGLEFGRFVSAAQNAQTTLGAIRDLGPGTYMVGVPKHALALVITPEGERYLYDPNAGVGKIEVGDLGRVFRYYGLRTSDPLFYVYEVHKPLSINTIH